MLSTTYISSVITIKLICFTTSFCYVALVINHLGLRDSTEAMSPTLVEMVLQDWTVAVPWVGALGIAVRVGYGYLGSRASGGWLW